MRISPLDITSTCQLVKMFARAISTGAARASARSMSTIVRSKVKPFKAPAVFRKCNMRAILHVSGHKAEATLSLTMKTTLQLMEPSRPSALRATRENGSCSSTTLWTGHSVRHLAFSCAPSRNTGASAMTNILTARIMPIRCSLPHGNR